MFCEMFRSSDVGGVVAEVPGSGYGAGNGQAGGQPFFSSTFVLAVLQDYFKIINDGFGCDLRFVVGKFIVSQSQRFAYGLGSLFDRDFGDLREDDGHGFYWQGFEAAHGQGDSLPNFFQGQFRMLAQAYEQNSVKASRVEH